MLNLLVAAAYLLGSIPFGYLIVKLREGRDIRAAGSGNIGAANVTRTAGTGAGVLTLLLDAAKGYLAVWLAASSTVSTTQRFSNSGSTSMAVVVSSSITGPSTR